MNISKEHKQWENKKTETEEGDEQKCPPVSVKH